MDLRGKSWVGSIYHKFEAICQEVDDFVSKDTVKYVENQVQSVGVSVKRLYSDVVGDILPPLGNDLKTNSQLVTGKQDDTRDDLKSIISNMTIPNCGDEKQLPVEQDSSDVLIKCKTSSSSDLDLVMCCTKPCEHSYQEVNTDVSLKQDGDTMKQNDAGNDFEEKITKVTPVTANSSSKNKVLFVTSENDDHDNEDQINITPSISSSPELSVHDPRLLAFKKQGILCRSFSNDTKPFWNISSASWSSEGELPLVQDINLVENMSFSEQPEASAEKACQYITMCMDSSTSLASDAAQSASGKDWTFYHSFSSKDQCIMVSNAVQSPELVFSYFSCDGEEAEKRVISSGCSTATEPLNLLDSTSADFTQRDDNTCNAHTESNDRVCNISNDCACSPSSATVANEIKGVDMPPVSNAVQSPELVFSYFSCDGEEAEKRVISSGCSTASVSLNLSDATSANFTQRDENTCNTHADSNDCVCNISNDCACSPSSVTEANEIKGVDMLPALSILESIAGSSESKHAQCWKEARSTILIPSSESGNSNVGVGDLNMESIDLSSSVKSDVLNCNFVHATSHRQKNFRYYKKLILDAFASRKRLSKEYEHLAIWYGDIGTESKQHFAPNSLPSSPTVFAHAAKTLDSEWEVL